MYSREYVDELYHHGIFGQKWGKRNGPPYPLNPEKDYTPEEKKFHKQISGNKAMTIKAGTEAYRASVNKKENLDKLYVNVSNAEFNKYKTMMGASNIIDKGKSYVHKYVTTQDIKIPSVKEQTKIERKMLKDPEIRKEIVESLMRKGDTREEATEALQKINFGAAYATLALGTVGPLGLGILSGHPAGIMAGAEMSYMGAMLGVALVAGAHAQRDRQLALVRVSVGDKENKKLNSALVKELEKKGYNAMRDTNDKGKNIASSSIILLDPKQQVKCEMTKEMTKSDFADAYAINKYKNLSKKTRKDIDFEDYVKDGEKAYDYLRKVHAVKADQREKQEEIFKKAGIQ